MKRATINAMIAVDVVGKDDEELFENFADAINSAADCSGIRDITVQHSETIEKKFTVPAGAEPFALLAKYRFGEDRDMCPMYDGAWWWTDGHAAYRCDGDPPEGWRQIENPFSNIDIPARPTEWSVHRKTRGGTEYVQASVDDAIAIQAKYYDAVHHAFQGAAKWKCGAEREMVRAYVDGKLVAVVMPFLVKNDGGAIQ